MKQDIRIYYYGSGVLHKHNRLKKTYPTVDDAKLAISKLKYNKQQWVITDYTDRYKSNIISISNNEGIFI